MLDKDFSEIFINNNKLPNSIDLENRYLSKLVSCVMNCQNRKIDNLVISKPNKFIIAPNIKIYQLIQDFDPKTTIPNDILESYISVNKIPSEYYGLYNKFICLEFVKIIEDNFNHKIDVALSFGELNVDMKIFYDNKPSRVFVDSLVDRVVFMIKLVNDLDKIKDILKIKIWLTKVTKKFNKNIKKLDKYEINSGCTVKYGNKIGSIFIWRQEECQKVLIHELIHALDIDNHSHCHEISKKIIQHYDIQDLNFINLFEAYTETWAILFNHIFMTIKDKDTKFISHYLDWETYFSIYQSSQILNYFGYKRFDNCEFYCLDGFLNKSNKFQQYTSVLSYFIFRSILLLNIGNFLKILFKKNSSRPWMTQLNGSLIYTFIDQSLKNTDWIIQVNKLIKKQFKYDTLKMTLF